MFILSAKALLEWHYEPVLHDDDKAEKFHLCGITPDTYTTA